MGTLSGDYGTNILDMLKKHGLQSEVYLEIKLFHFTNVYVYSVT